MAITVRTTGMREIATTSTPNTPTVTGRLAGGTRAASACGQAPARLASTTAPNSTYSTAKMVRKMRRKRDMSPARVSASARRSPVTAIPVAPETPSSRLTRKARAAKAAEATARIRRPGVRLIKSVSPAAPAGAILTGPGARPFTRKQRPRARRA
jgi:hypothetical protein